MAGQKSRSHAHYDKGKCMAYARERFGQKKNAGLMMCFHEAWAWAVQFTRLKSLASLGWNLLHEAKLRARAVYVFDIGLTFDLTSLIPCKNIIRSGKSYNYDVIYYTAKGKTKL